MNLIIICHVTMTFRLAFLHIVNKNKDLNALELSCLFFSLIWQGKDSRKDFLKSEDFRFNWQWCLWQATEIQMTSQPSQTLWNDMPNSLHLSPDSILCLCQKECNYFRSLVMTGIAKPRGFAIYYGSETQIIIDSKFPTSLSSWWMGPFLSLISNIQAVKLRSL